MPSPLGTSSVKGTRRREKQEGDSRKRTASGWHSIRGKKQEGTKQERRIEDEGQHEWMSEGTQH